MEASGFKMGPFKLMDLIGMDINLAVSKASMKFSAGRTLCTLLPAGG
jgi:3-hydroxyacyl-CoA dehydrogenase